jgi:PEP-CTERM motif
MKKLLLACAASMVGLAVQANILDFSGNICSDASNGSGAMVACSNGSRINQSYGDTALVDVTFKSRLGGPDSMFFWDSGYNKLINIAYGDPSFAPEITLAAIGSTISLELLKLASWLDEKHASQLTVIDLATNTVVFKNGFDVVETIYTFSFGLESNVGFAIQFGPEGYYVGIDNIQFTTTPVPEASTYAMLLAGLAAVGSVVRRRTRR